MEYLPQDIILEIFSFLNQCDLSNVANTCQYFSNLIKTSSSLMRKFSIELSPNRFHIQLSDAHHQNAHIQRYRSFCANVPICLSNYSSSLKRLTLSEIFFNTLTEYRELLRHFVNLHTLKMENCRIKSDIYNDVAVTLPSLRKLEVIRGSWMLFKLLSNCTTVTHLKFENFIKDSRNLSHFGNFLMQNENLKELRVAGNAKSFINFATNYKFHLKSLFFDNVYFNEINDELKMIEFLKSTSESLKELTVYNAPRDLILKCILNDLRSLEKLDIGISLLPESSNYFHVIRKNYKLKTLIMNGKLKSMDVIKGILQHYCSIESLQILGTPPSDINDLLNSISENQKHLQHLTLPALPGLISPIINFKNLQSLEILHLRNSSEVLNFTFIVIYSPNLSKISIRRVENEMMSNSNIGAVTSKAKFLKDLSLGKYFEFDDQALNIVKNTAKSLKKLTVYTPNVEQTKTMVERIHSDGLNCYVHEFNKLTSDIEESKMAKVATYNSITNYETFIRGTDNVENVRFHREPELHVARLRRIARRRFQLQLRRHEHPHRQENGNGNAANANGHGFHFFMAPRGRMQRNYELAEDWEMVQSSDDSSDDENEILAMHNGANVGRN